MDALSRDAPRGLVAPRWNGRGGHGDVALVHAPVFTLRPVLIPPPTPGVTQVHEKGELGGKTV